MTQRTKKELTAWAVVIACILILLIGEGCAPTGYGCDGRSKYITGHRPNGYGY